MLVQISIIEEDMERRQAFYETLNTVDPNLQFTIEVGGRQLYFVDLSISSVNNRLKFSVYN